MLFYLPSCEANHLIIYFVLSLDEKLLSRLEPDQLRSIAESCQSKVRPVLAFLAKLSHRVFFCGRCFRTRRVQRN